MSPDVRLPATPVPAGAPALTGTVAGSAADGRILLATEQGSVLVQTSPAPVVGTRVALTLPGTIPAPEALLAQAGEGFDPLHGPDWPNLRRTMEALSHADPVAGRALAQQIVPMATPRLAGAISHFLRTAREGDARKWLGERGVTALESTGQTDLVGKLGRDFEEMGRQAAAPSGEWRAFSLPFSDGSEISRIQLYVRHPVDEDTGKESDGRPQKGEKRFLVELDMSRLGPVQLDGFVRGKQFDLILRTREPLSAEMRRDIQALFTDTVSALGLTGSTVFHPGAQGWVTVPVAQKPVRGVLA
jgi:hypothetical protein